LLSLATYAQELSKTKNLNLLGFSLTLIEKLMSYKLGWETLNVEFLRDIVPFIYSPNLTASRRAIEIVSHLMNSPKHGFSTIDSAIRRHAESERQVCLSLFLSLSLSLPYPYVCLHRNHMKAWYSYSVAEI